LSLGSKDGSKNLDYTVVAYSKNLYKNTLIRALTDDFGDTV